MDSPTQNKAKNYFGSFEQSIQMNHAVLKSLFQKYHVTSISK